jgi:uncharacterized integral membrane protein (TIGR00697 family)
MSTPETVATEEAHRRGRHYRYYDLVMAGFVTVLLCSNLIGPAKVARLTFPEGFSLPLIGSHLDFGAGNIFFPIGYIFGDILTEVYGYARARKVIWAGFLGLAFSAFMTQVIIRLPTSPADDYTQTYQPAIAIAFGNTWRVVLASLIAYWCGDFLNSYVLAKLKVRTAGRWLWTRTIGSTIVGQGVDSLIFYPLAFAGIWETPMLLKLMLFNWCFKVAVEVVFTPITYLIVGALKRAEREDFFDDDTNFSPFSLRD